MVVVIPVCEKDCHLVLKNLEWVASLEKHLPFEAIVSSDHKDSLEAIIKAAEGLFDKITPCFYSEYAGDPAWPRIQNHAWQEAARWVSANRKGCSWFWWESDATPLRAGWLKELADAHAAGGKPFSGHIVPSMGHMTGVGIYPSSIAEFCPDALFCSAAPFDVVLKSETVGQDRVHKINNLIQHILDVGGSSMNFDSEARLGILEPDAVIFHKCKDGSLIDALKAGAKRIPKGQYLPLACVIPFSTRDYDATKGLLEWMDELGGCKGHEVLLMADCKIPEMGRRYLAKLAARVFDKVHHFATPFTLQDEQKPFGSNWMFQCAAGYMEREVGSPFWWNEPDCIPLTEGWLDRLQGEYYTHGTPFMGFSAKRLSSTAVYPAKVSEHLPGVFALAGPVEFVSEVEPMDSVTPLIQLEQPITFKTQKDLKRISSKAVAFHSNKDGSLIKLLRQKRSTS